MFRLILYVISGILFSSASLSYYFNSSFNNLEWINLLFNFSLLATLIGGAMLVIQGGFFIGIIRSFRIFFRKTNPLKQVLEDIEGIREESFTDPTAYTLTFPMLYSGILLLLFSIIYSWAVF